MKSSIPGLRKDAIKAMTALALIALVMIPVMPYIIGIQLAYKAFQTGNPAWASAGQGYEYGGAGFASVGATLVGLAIYLYFEEDAALWLVLALGFGGAGLIALGIYLA